MNDGHSSWIVSASAQGYVAASASLSITIHKYCTENTVFSFKFAIAHRGEFFHVVFYAGWLARRQSRISKPAEKERVQFKISATLFQLQDNHNDDCVQQKIQVAENAHNSTNKWQWMIYMIVVIVGISRWFIAISLQLVLYTAWPQIILCSIYAI